jgi:ATP-binding cassette subfamily B protein
MDMTTSKRNNDRILYRRLFMQGGAYWVHLVGVSLLSLFPAPSALLLPLPLKIAVDSIIGDRPIPVFLRMVW